MADVPADPTPETIFVSYDTLRVFKASKARRRAKKGLGWNFCFRLCSGGTLHKRSTTIPIFFSRTISVGNCLRTVVT